MYKTGKLILTSSETGRAGQVRLHGLCISSDAYVQRLHIHAKAPIQVSITENGAFEFYAENSRYIVGFVEDQTIMESGVFLNLGIEHLEHPYRK